MVALQHLYRAGISSSAAASECWGGLDFLWVCTQTPFCPLVSVVAFLSPRLMWQGASGVRAALCRQLKVQRSSGCSERFISQSSIFSSFRFDEVVIFESLKVQQQKCDRGLSENSRHHVRYSRTSWNNNCSLKVEESTDENKSMGHMCVAVSVCVKNKYGTDV